MSEHSPIDTAVIGVGRMGRHHARTYANMPQANLVAVVDGDLERAEVAADEHNCRALGSVEELIDQCPSVKAVTIAVPTVHHAAVAAPLLARDIACLIEKPLAPSIEEASKLVDLADRSNAVVQIGHTERFNPIVRALTALDITPRFMEVVRISPMTFRSLDVGVVMDMMIHDLDIVLKMAGSALKEVHATGVTVLAGHEDVANTRLVFENGCVANITASRLALKTDRKLRIFSETSYVSLDYQDQKGMVITRSANETELEHVREQIRNGEDLSELRYSELVHVQKLRAKKEHTESDPLTAQATSFLQAVREGGDAEVTVHDGFRAVEAAERIVDAIAKHHWEGMAQPRV